MNLLDENVPESQRRLLESRRISVRQIGHDTGRKGMKDDEIISLLHQSDRLTFFTLDEDFYDRRLCHGGYCLVYLDVEEEMLAETVRRFLRYRAFNSKAKRMGRVIRAFPTGLTVWRIHEEQEGRLSWK
jgi:predicted nuclease of predicted toxin-antitoxin system